MTLSPSIRRNLTRVIPFGIIWLFFGWVFLSVEYAVTDGYRYLPEGAIRPDGLVFLFASTAVTILGLFVGVIELGWLSRVFARETFLRSMIYKLLIYLSLLEVVILITYPMAASIEMGLGVLDKQVWSKYVEYINSSSHWSTMLQMFVSLAASLFYAGISDNIGSANLLRLITGRYHQPREEVRIFLFLDMNQSTAIAEQLGHTRYFELLRAFYSDLSKGVIAHWGEIYQYVGDEVVVSWTRKKGLKDRNCLECFYHMKADLQRRHSWYTHHYGVTPTFKAGMHIGPVTTGEIGALKKEIVFSGDVLNTTARLQGLCHQYGTDLLLSRSLAEVLDLEIDSITSLGELKLKGKSEVVEVVSVVRGKSGEWGVGSGQ